MFCLSPDATSVTLTIGNTSANNSKLVLLNFDPPVNLTWCDIPASSELRWTLDGVQTQELKQVSTNKVVENQTLMFNDQEYINSSKPVAVQLIKTVVVRFKVSTFVCEII